MLTSSCRLSLVDHRVHKRAIRTLADLNNEHPYELPQKHVKISMPERFLDRTEVKSELTRRLAVPEQGMYWITVGPNASGKTSLLQEVAAESNANGTRVVSFPISSLCRLLVSSVANLYAHVMFLQ